MGMDECVCKHILNQYVCKSTLRYDRNVDWLDVNVILVSLGQNVRKCKKKKGGGGSRNSP